jgi:EAL domain-containing protein (putative c-di-GMP-specific phosphodiesterase class I)
MALYPADGADLETLFKNADIALYRAKAGGGGTYRSFEPLMYEAVRKRRMLEEDLRRAVAAGGIEVHFQPQFECRSLRLVGFEALARWHHPRTGWVSPDLFVPVAEECGLIGRLGLNVLKQACAEAARWTRSCKVAVNVSAAQLRSSDFHDSVAEVLAATALPPHLLELEITESVVSEDREHVATVLNALRRLGIRVALDDFGTGYSSLSNLRRFRFDKIKIDQSFVQTQDHDPESRIILESVLAMSLRLGLVVTAEGVETPEQLSLLRAQGCPEVQGHLLGAAMRACEAASLVEASDNVAAAQVAAGLV